MDGDQVVITFGFREGEQGKVYKKVVHGENGDAITMYYVQFRDDTYGCYYEDELEFIDE